MPWQLNELATVIVTCPPPPLPSFRARNAMAVDYELAVVMVTCPPPLLTSSPLLPFRWGESPWLENYHQPILSWKLPPPPPESPWENLQVSCWPSWHECRLLVVPGVAVLGFVRLYGISGPFCLQFGKMSTCDFYDVAITTMNLHVWVLLFLQLPDKVPGEVGRKSRHQQNVSKQHRDCDGTEPHVGARRRRVREM